MGSTVFDRRPPSPAAVEHALAGSTHGVFWLADHPGSRFDPLTADARVDLLVIGGGYTGLWTALQAKERDPHLRIMVVDGGTVGWAASGRNGGFCESSLTHGYDNGMSRWPAEMPQLARLGHANIRGIVDTVERYGMDVDLVESGLVKLAIEPHQLEWLETRPRDDRHVFLDRDAMASEIASPTYLAGYWDKDENVLVHPAKLVAELARTVSELGVTICERTPVRGLDARPTEVRARTAGGTITADRAVLATNAFPSLLTRNRLMTVPVYDYVLATEPLSTAQLDAIGWRNRQGLSDLANQFHYYRMTADDRIVYGGYDAIYHAGRTVRREFDDRPETHRKLAAHFLTTFPQLEGIRFEHRWGGVIDANTRFCAHFGTAHHGRVAYAAGFTGLGVAASRFAGAVMLDLLSGRPTELTELQMVRERPLPFPPEPLAAIGINATRWAMDRADRNGGRRNLMLRTLDRLGLGFTS